MNKKEATQYKLEEALQRLLTAKTLRIASSRKLSMRAVEEEAGLGNGTCYYYPDIVNKIKKEKCKKQFNGQANLNNKVDLQAIREKRNIEKKIKIKYRNENVELKERVAKMASEHHHFAYALQQANKKIMELEKKLEEKNAELTDNKRKVIKLNNKLN